VLPVIHQSCSYACDFIVFGDLKADEMGIPIKKPLSTRNGMACCKVLDEELKSNAILLP
jgi:hypothetical protein